MERSRGQAAGDFARDAIEVGVCVWSPRISWIGRRLSAREFLCVEGVEISNQVVDQNYMGVRGECW